ncbi:MAG: DUF4270 domain-containing protein [Bacteroidales bacterium]
MKKLISPRLRGGFFSSMLPIIAIGALLLTWQSCAEPDEVGLNLIDEKASIKTTDTLTIEAYTLADDSIPTNLGAQNLLGLMHDPVFGKIRATVFTEFRLPENDFSLGEEPVLDSVRLSFGYTGRYSGDLSTHQTLRVYELSENLPDADTLYSNVFVDYYPQEIGMLNLKPAPQDTVLIDTVDYAPHFVIPLSMEFGQKILDANGTTYFENIPSFLDYFKGLYVAVDDDFQEGGAIFNLNMFSAFTRLQLYYRNEGDTVSRLQNFNISEFTNRVTYVETYGYENAHPLIQQQVLDQQRELGDSLLFLQSLGSLKANIKLPFLEELSQTADIAINQARLIIPVQQDMVEEMYPAANRLLLFSYDDQGQMEFLTDLQIGDEYFGGTYDEENNYYSFNITHYLQQVLNGNISNNGLSLVIGGAAENAQRVVLHGPGRDEDPLRLELIYSVFE